MTIFFGKTRYGVLLLLWFIAIASIMACRQDEDDTGSLKVAMLTLHKPRVLMLYNSDDHYPSMLVQNTRQVLQYAKIAYQECDLAQAEMADLHPYAAVLLMTEMIYKLSSNDCQRIKEYVADGGGLAVLYRGWNENLLDLFGIEADGPASFYEEEQTLRFTEDFIPGIRSNVIRNQDFSCYDLNVMPQTMIFARTSRLPIVWFHRFGKGRVVYWNTSLLVEKVNRGFILRSLSLVQTHTIIPITNIGLFYLDDYPNSSSNDKVEPIKSEFDQTMSEFYYLRWYPDMMKLAKKYGIKYTAVVVFNYNGQTKPPYMFYEWLNGKIQFGDRLIPAAQWGVQHLDPSNELGLHGYNHQSLTLRNWRDIGNMEDAIAQARHRWVVDNLGEFPFTYVPPHNVYDSTGVQALHHVFPEIKVIASQYLGDFATGGDREFAPEPWNEAIYDMPRVTSGFILTEFDKRAMLSLLQTMGIWSHFVHPDDVYPFGERYDEEMLKEEHIHSIRWYGEPQKNGLYYQLDHWLDFVKQYYPWLRFMTTKAALPELKRYLTNNVLYAIQKNRIMITMESAPMYFYFYVPSDQKIASLKGAEIVHEYHNTLDHCFVLKANKKNVTIHLSVRK